MYALILIVTATVYSNSPSVHTNVIEFESQSKCVAALEQIKKDSSKSSNQLSVRVTGSCVKINGNLFS